MTPATLVVFGRYWYDFLVVSWVVGFFLIECLLLFRSTIIGWAMTAKCLVLAGVFAWALFNPPPLMHESITIEKAGIYSVLIVVLGAVIGILIWMRIMRMVVIVGKGDD